MNSNFAEKARMLEAVKNGNGINYTLNEGYKILRNPIVMFDTSYNLLAYIEGITTDDPLWNEITMLGTFSHETIDFFNEEKFIEDYARSDVVALMTSEKLKYDRLNGKIFDKDGVQLGNVNVTACMKPFEEGDIELVALLCEKLSIELRNSEFYKKIDRVYEETLLIDLSDETAQNDGYTIEKLRGLYENHKPNLHLGVVDISQCDRTLTHLAYYRDLFRRMQPEYRYYIHLNNIVAIISTNNARLSFDKDLRPLNEFFARHRIFAGISGAFQSLLELRQHYREAICALNYGLKSERKQHIFRYDDIRIEHFLCSARNSGEMNVICSPTVFSIREYDKENGTSLLKVLYVYLLYGKDSESACACLGLPQEELRIQLKKLEELFEIEWENGDTLCNIYLTIKMLDCVAD